MRQPRRWWRRLLAIATVSCLSLVAMPSARAEWTEEYWFGQLHISQAWTLSKGAGVTVAVVDTGVNDNLGDLRGQVLPGADFSGQKTDGRSDAGNSCDKLGCYSHGSDMSMLIAGTGKGTGFQGVAPAAKILPVKVQARTGDVVSSHTVADGIRWAVDHGAKIINLSLGNPGACDPFTGPAVKYAYDHDVIVVAAAGNAGRASVDSPANCPGALAVSATDGGPQTGAIPIWSGSNYGPEISFTGIGVDMPQELTTGTKVLHGNGTSDATAITSGDLALLRSRFPTMSARDIITRALWALHNGAGVANLGKRINDKIGYGMILPYQAMSTPPPAGAANPIYAAWQAEFAASQSTSPSAPSSTPPSSTGTGTGGIQAPTPKRDSASSSSASTGAVIGVIAGVLVLVIIGVVLAVRRRGTAAPRA